jgi:hypothetical protein
MSGKPFSWGEIGGERDQKSSSERRDLLPPPRRPRLELVALPTTSSRLLRRDRLAARRRSWMRSALAVACALRCLGLFGKPAQDCVRGAAGRCHAGSTRPRALRRQPAAERLLLAPLLLLVALLEGLDLTVALVVGVARRPPSRLLRKSQIQTDRGQTVEGTHQAFTFTSVVADRIVQGSGVSCSMRHGGSVEPRRQPIARTAISPVNGLGFRSWGP